MRQNNGSALSKAELVTYGRLLCRLYRACVQQGYYDRHLLKRQILYRYKFVCMVFYPEWVAKIKRKILDFGL